MEKQVWEKALCVNIDVVKKYKQQKMLIKIILKN